MRMSDRTLNRLRVNGDFIDQSKSRYPEAPNPQFWGLSESCSPRIGGRGASGHLFLEITSLVTGLDVAEFADRAVVFDRPDIVTANHIAIFVNIDIAAGSLVVDGFPGFEQF